MVAGGGSRGAPAGTSGGGVGGGGGGGGGSGRLRAGGGGGGCSMAGRAGHGAGQHAVPSRPPGHGAQALANVGGGGGHGDRIHEVNGNTAELQGAHAAAAARGAADDGARAQGFGQVICDLGQRISRAAGHDEFAGAQQFFGLAPF